MIAKMSSNAGAAVPPADRTPSSASSPVAASKPSATRNAAAACANRFCSAPRHTDGSSSLKNSAVRRVRSAASGASRSARSANSSGPGACRGLPAAHAPTLAQTARLTRLRNRQQGLNSHFGAWSKPPAGVANRVTVQDVKREQAGFLAWLKNSTAPGGCQCAQATPDGLACVHDRAWRPRGDRMQRTPMAAEVAAS